MPLTVPIPLLCSSRSWHKHGVISHAKLYTLYIFKLLAISVLGVSEEQAGTTDWYLQHLNPLRFVQLGLKQQVAYIVSVDGTLARLNLRDGNLHWRQVQGSGTSNTSLYHAMLAPKQDALITVSGSPEATHLRVWREADGQLVWESVLHMQGVGSPQQAGATVGVDAKGSTVSLAVFAGQVTAHSLGGKVLWYETLAELQPTDECIVSISKGIGLLLCSKPGGTNQQLWRLKLADGARDGPYTLKVPYKTTGSWSNAGSFFVAEAADAHLCFIQAFAGTVMCHAATSLGLEGAIHSVEGAAERRALVTSSTGVTLLALHDDKVTVLATVPDAQTASSNAGQQVAAAVVNRGYGDGLFIKVLDLDTGKELAVDSIPQLGITFADSTPVPAVLSAIGSYTAKDGGTGYRVLVALSDGTVGLAQQGQTVWQRMDGLASTKQVLFLDLPSAAAAAADHSAAPAAPGTVSGFMAPVQQWWAAAGQQQVRLQLLQLKVQLQLGTPEDAAELRLLRHLTSDKLLPYRDTLGFRRLLLALTDHGAVHALHSGDGHVMWSWRGLRDRRTTHMLTWREPHTLQQAPEVLLLTAGPDGEDPTAVVLNVHTGQQQGAAVPLPAGLRRVVPLPSQHTGHEAMQQHSYALLTGAGEKATATILPMSTTAQDVFFWEASGSSLHGYKVTTDGSSAATRMWSVLIAAKGQHILRIETPDPSNPVHSSSKVLGDRTLKFKYVSPQLIFAAVGPSNQRLLDDSKIGEVAITVWIINGVTGEVLHRQKHEGARGPVHALFCENWVVYHYLRLDGHRYQMSIVELYDDEARHLTLRDVLFNDNMRNTSRSASQHSHVEVLQQSYLPVHLAPLRVLAATTTLQGMAQKTLLLGTQTGKVYGLERRMLDPRRPIRPNNKPTAEDMEEGLAPYSPVLPFRTTGYLTTNKQVAGLRGITTASTKLESTSLVLAYGQDMYFTRAMPSASFDSLPVEFPFALLVAMTTAMLLASVMIRRLADAKTIKDKWA